MIDVLGIGLNATDTVILTPKFPEYAGKEAFEREFVSPGGQVASAMVACARLGLSASYIGTVGDDDRGKIQVADLISSGVDITGVITRPGCPNQTAYIVVDTRTGERTVLWQRAICLRLRPEEIDASKIAMSRILHLDGCDTEAAALAASIAREHATPVCIDVDTVYPGFERVLQNVDYLMASANWIGDWTGDSDAFTALPRLSSEYKLRVAGMTLGDGGAVAYANSVWHYAPAFAVHAIDTTGAGDAFHGAFCYGVLQGMPLGRVLEFANAAAALNCTAYGARGHLPSVQEVYNLIEHGARHDAIPAYAEFAA